MYILFASVIQEFVNTKCMKMSDLGFSSHFPILLKESSRPYEGLQIMVFVGLIDEVLFAFNGVRPDGRSSCPALFFLSNLLFHAILTRKGKGLLGRLQTPRDNSAGDDNGIKLASCLRTIGPCGGREIEHRYVFPSFTQLELYGVHGCVCTMYTECIKENIDKM